jgi:putative resolvase
MASHDQAEQLKTQAARLGKHCVDVGFTEVEDISNLGKWPEISEEGPAATAAGCSSGPLRRAS